jgi:hypothetical protein
MSPDPLQGAKKITIEKKILQGLKVPGLPA